VRYSLWFSMRSQVEFDHGCAPEKVRLIRADQSHATVDLDVCGTVRRYKLFSSGGVTGTVTWLDVTALYPASSLPPPLPPLGK
jgi:hypothetical protein